jgi:four helix bundle protein
MVNRSFRDLEVWRESMQLVEEIYRLTAGFPSEERFGLASQLRRAAVSIPSNIGEGARRKRRRPFLYHLEIALGSQGESMSRWRSRHDWACAAPAPTKRSYRGSTESGECSMG